MKFVHIIFCVVNIDAYTVPLSFTETIHDQFHIITVEKLEFNGVLFDPRLSKSFK